MKLIFNNKIFYSVFPLFNDELDENDLESFQNESGQNDSELGEMNRNRVVGPK